MRTKLDKRQFCSDSGQKRDKKARIGKGSDLVSQVKTLNIPTPTAQRQPLGEAKYRGMSSEQEY
jgi:hypothetical protein